jgi:hypothetical protein
MRWIAGILLVCAALLKAAELWSQPAITVLNPSTRWLLPLQTGLELGFGLVVLSGLYWRAVRWLAALLFTGFAAYSLYLAVTGAGSCGCFGPIHIHPWWTFSLDIVVVLGLLISSLRSGKTASVESGMGDTRPLHFAHQRGVLAVAMGVAVLSSAALVRYADRKTAIADEGIGLLGQLVILEPEEWVDKPLPIAEHIDLDLSAGEWNLLLHRHDCPVCHEVLPRFEQSAATGQRIALIEVPPYGDMRQRESACRQGRLTDDREWFVQTPVEIRLVDGLVTAVQSHGH